MTRNHFKLGAALAVAAALTASAIAAAPSSAKKLPSYGGLGLTSGKAGGAMTFALGDAPATFNYYGAIDAPTKEITLQVFDTLLDLNLETYKAEAGLVTSWSHTGLKTWTFKLRPGITWHDGKPFTADDVIFTLEQIVASPETRAGDAAVFTAADGTKTKFTKVDNLTFRIDLPRPNAAFLQQIRSFPIMPKHVLVGSTPEGGGKAADINSVWTTNTDPTKIVGTGPFKIQSYTPGQKVTLVKNENYWKLDSAGKQLPYLDRLEFLVVRTPEAQSAQFLSGAVDILNITGAQFPDFKSKEVGGADFKVVRNVALFGSPPHLAFNFDDKDAALAKVFSNLRFRQAMQAAMNRARIIETVYNGQATLPGTPTAPVNKDFYVDTTKYLGEFDLKKAAQLLDQAGYKDTDRDGTRNISANKELEFTLTFGNDSSVYPPIATILQNDFKAIGVKVNLKGIPSAQLLATGRGTDWSAIIVALGNLPDPELRKPIWQPGGSLYYWHRSTQPKAPGEKPNFAAMTSWERRIYDIFEEGSTLADPAKRKGIYGGWQVLNAQYLPVIMIAKPANIAVAHNNVGNFVYNLGQIPGYNPVILYFNK